MEAVSMDALVREAYTDCWKTLVTFLRQAFAAERFTTEAVSMDTLTKEAPVDS